MAGSIVAFFVNDWIYITKTESAVQIYLKEKYNEDFRCEVAPGSIDFIRVYWIEAYPINNTECKFRVIDFGYTYSPYEDFYYNSLFSKQISAYVYDALKDLDIPMDGFEASIPENGTNSVTVGKFGIDVFWDRVVNVDIVVDSDEKLDMIDNNEKEIIDAVYKRINVAESIYINIKRVNQQGNVRNYSINPYEIRYDKSYDLNNIYVKVYNMDEDSNKAVVKYVFNIDTNQFVDIR
jgi:hypothetical protein